MQKHAELGVGIVGGFEMLEVEEIDQDSADESADHLAGQVPGHVRPRNPPRWAAATASVTAGFKCAPLNVDVQNTADEDRHPPAEGDDDPA